MRTSFDSALDTATDAANGALQTATDTANGAFHTATDAATGAFQTATEAIGAAEEFTALAADKLVEGAVLAASSSRWRSKRLTLALVLLAVVAGVFLWRRRSNDGTDADDEKA